MNYIRTAMLLAGMTALFMGIGFMIGGQSGMLIALAIAAAMNVFSYWNADKMVLRMHHAQEVDERSMPDFYRMVQRLAQNADLPMPKVYIINNPQPNAFATGRNPQNAAVAATTGLLNMLTPEEVAGVMAHELAVGRDRLAHAERDQAWAEMARQVAHEVKNPLQPMRMTAQLLQRARGENDPRADQVAERLARTVLEQTEALDRIASDFRSFAGIAAAQKSVVVVDDWLAELREQTARLFADKPLTLTFAAGAADASISIDQKSMARVFVNLVQNAIEAAHGPVAVALSSRRDADRIVVAIVDDGPGVPDDVRDKLFDPYFTTKTSGTGLGLAICRRLVEAHGGAIRLDSTRAGETRFAIELPVV